jgi:hypothetical protein
MADNYVAYAATYDDAEAAKDDFSTLREAGLRDITAAPLLSGKRGRRVDGDWVTREVPLPSAPAAVAMLTIRWPP